MANFKKIMLKRSIDIKYLDGPSDPKIRQIKYKYTTHSRDTSDEIFADLICRKLTVWPCFYTIILLADLENMSLDFL